MTKRKKGPLTGRELLGSFEGNAGNQPVRHANHLREDLMESRLEAIGRAMTKACRLRVSPDSCRIWTNHSRRYESLNEVRCADLIYSFQQDGGQLLPAQVRPVDDHSGYSYELICGARRHWTAKYLAVDLMVEILKLTDEQAFRLVDAENRVRQDLCDYERGWGYRRTLEQSGVDPKTLAKQLGQTVEWLNRLLSLTELPQEIVDAYGDVTDITTDHGMVLRRLLERPRARTAVLARAQELARVPTDGERVLADLRAVAEAATE